MRIILLLSPISWKGRGVLDPQEQRLPGPGRLVGWRSLFLRPLCYITTGEENFRPAREGEHFPQLIFVIGAPNRSHCPLWAYLVLCEGMSLPRLPSIARWKDRKCQIWVASFDWMGNVRRFAVTLFLQFWALKWFIFLLAPLITSYITSMGYSCTWEGSREKQVYIMFSGLEVPLLLKSSF